MAQFSSPDVLDGRAVAELLHLPHSTVLEFARRGVIPAHKLGRRWLFLRDEVDAAVRAAPANPMPEATRVPPPRRRTPNARASQLLLPLDGTPRQTAHS
jgi:excisionase family DNA binding protein